MPKSLNIALIQTHLHWEDPARNRKMFDEKIESIPDDVDVIVLPEMFTSGFTMKPGHLEASEGGITLKWMQDLAKAKEAAVVGSIVFQEADQFF
jgi:omega-amidase